MRDTNIVLTYAHKNDSDGSSYYGFYEHSESRIWTKLLYGKLRDTKYSTHLLKETDLSSKIYKINIIRPTICLEIHFNSFKNEKVNGCETLYFPGSVKGKALATKVHNSYKTCIRKDRGIKEGWYKMDAPGKVDYPGDIDGDEKHLTFLKRTKATALIIEPEFISQKKTIINARSCCTEKIAQGIVRYLDDINASG